MIEKLNLFVFPQIHSKEFGWFFLHALLESLVLAIIHSNQERFLLDKPSWKSKTPKLKYLVSIAVLSIYSNTKDMSATLQTLNWYFADIHVKCNISSKTTTNLSLHYKAIATSRKNLFSIPGESQCVQTPWSIFSWYILKVWKEKGGQNYVVVWSVYYSMDYMAGAEI